MALTEIVITRALTKIATDPKVFWNTLNNVNGWRLQQNKVFGNYRIIDPNNIRKAWGGKKAILDLFEKL